MKMECLMKPMPQAPELAKHFFIFNALLNYHRFCVSALYRRQGDTGQKPALVGATASLKYSFSSATGSPLDI